MHRTEPEETGQTPSQPRPRDVLADVYALRRKVALGVYAVITGDLPLYYFTGYTWTQIALLAVVGWVVAGCAIYVAFAQIIKLRKRTSYPELLLVSLGDTGGSLEAATEALFILEGLLETESAFIALEVNGAMRPVARRGIQDDEAKWVMEAHATQLETAITGRYPADIVAESGRRAAFVAIVALKRSVGVLYVSASSGDGLSDRSLLNDIGGALGLSMENLRQKEQLLQKESRLRSVITGAPVVLFAVNTEGTIVFHEGQAMERVGISPDTLIGRPVSDVYASYPEILQSFRRAFAGDEVISTARIEANGHRVIFEYRLAPERDEHGRVTGVIGVATDVSQRKAAEDALGESERFLSTLVGNLPGFVIRLEGVPGDLRVKYVSQGLQDITGYSADEMTGQPLSALADRIHPADRAELRRLVALAGEGGGPFESEFLFTHKSGEERWLWQQGEVLVDDSGETIVVEAFTMDITERKRAKDALTESERFLSTLVGNLPGFVMRCSMDDKRTIQYVSDGVKDLIGLDAASVLGQPLVTLGDLVNPDDRLELVKRIVRSAISGGRFEGEFRAKFGDEERWFWQQGQTVKDDEGRPIALEMFTMDITERKRSEAALSQSERFMTTLVGNLPGFVLRGTIGEDPTILYVSEGIRVTGYGPEDLVGKPLSVLAPVMREPDKWRLAGAIMDAAGDGGRFEIEFPIQHVDGHEIWLWEQGQVVRDERGAPTGVEAFIMDVTERKRAEQALEESEERFRDIFENARDAMFTYDFQGRFISANQRMADMLGYERQELLDLNVGKVVPPEHHALAAEGLRRVFHGEQSSYEVDLLTKDGRRIPVEITCRFVPDKRGDPSMVQGIGRDISERRQAEETIRRLAYHDALTGLPNRALFEDRLRLALAQARRQREMLGVLFLDLDRFKDVNDTLGHSAGDKLLQSVANDLALLVREGDTVARAGGDEFTLLLPGVERTEDVIEVAERILECFRQSRVINGQEFRSTASIGVTMYPADGRDGEALLRNADTAMYRAKEHGRDNYQLYTEAMNQRMMERLSFEQSLRHALTRDELSVFYQPIVDLESGHVTGAEALVRWYHPTRGIVFPDEFIPLAEETGLIVDIGQFVLREACRQIMEWRSHGIELGRVAVNLSARQLQQEDLVARITDVLEETGAPPHVIQLEITEGAVLKNVDHAIAMLKQLRAMGLSIALDDFGTGYSSLTHLKRFPVDAVKIDRSFVRDLEHDPSDATIVSTVIGMADNLGLRVIAEGVETAHQLAFLRARGCSEFQGYLFSRPVPPERFAEIFAPSSRNGTNGSHSFEDEARDTDPLPAA